MVGFFKDLKVIELATVLAGPDVGMFFAEMGCQVIKYESSGTGDITRAWKNANEDKNSSVSAYFSAINYKKEYRSINLKDAGDMAALHEELATADILLTNFKNSSARKYGFDAATISSQFPSLIHGRITGFGPDVNRSAYDVILQAETGYMSINGQADGPPTKMPVALIDVLAAHQLKEGILVALLDRQKTGRGAFVQVSLYDAAISSLKNQASNYLMSDFLPTRIGSKHPNIAPYGDIFYTKDDLPVVTAVGSDGQFEKLLDLFEVGDGSFDLFAKNVDRCRQREKLIAALAPYFRKYQRQDLLKMCIERDIPIGAIYNLKEVFACKPARALVAEEVIEGQVTKRVRNAVFTITPNA